MDGLRFYHTDHLGSSDVITNTAGTVVEHTEHLPYGTISRHDGPKNLPHKFTGQRQDSANTGLILFPARAYDPQLGRFLQPDTFVQSPGDPQTLNRYAYVRNNPVNLVDPTGYSFWKKFFAIVGIVAAAVAVVATAGAALGAAPAVAAVIGEGVSLGTIGSTAGWVAAGSFLTSSLLPGQSGGLSPPATAAIMMGAATIASGGLAPAALLGSAALQAGIGYAGTRLLESPMAQEGIGRAAGALGRFGMSPRAAVLLVSLAAGTAVFGGLSALAGARSAGAAAAISEDTIPAGNRLSTIRFTQPGEVFERFESTRLSSKVLPGGGLKPETFATTPGTGLNQLNVNQALNLPLKNIPRDVRFTIEPPPGTAIIGPNSIVGGTESEVQFIYGLPRVGAVKGPYRVPRD